MPATTAINAVVTVAPLKGLVEPLLPKGSAVTVLMQPGRSEHGYEFTPADIAAMAKADVFVYVGLNLEGPVERTLAKQSVPNRQVVCFAEAVGIKAAEHDHEAHDHDKEMHDEHDAHDGHDHGSGYIDPHLWLDPVLVGQLIPKLRNAIGGAEQAKGLYNDAERERLLLAGDELEKRVTAVDQEWRTRLEPLKGVSVVTHHNAFNRPAERYGFRVAAVIREFETSEPSPGDIANVVEAIRKEGVHVIFVEPQFNTVAAIRIATAARVNVGTLDPLGRGDWFLLMKSNLDSLVSNLPQLPPEPSPPKAGGP